MGNKEYCKNFRYHQYEGQTECRFDFLKNLVVDAVYIEQELPEYKNNLLIEALPKPLYNSAEVANALSNRPFFQEDEKQKGEYYRRQACRRLESAVIPTPEFISIYNTIDTCIHEGYKDKSFMDKAYLSTLRDKRIFELNNTEFSGLKYGGSILGISSGGKTTAIRSILRLYPQAIIHSCNEEIKASCAQIVWLKIDCPHDASRGGLCWDILVKIDEILKTDYSIIYKNSTVEKKLVQIKMLFYKYRVGILVIDEIEFLSQNSKDSDKLLKFIVHLNNVIGVPIITIGNFDAYKSLFLDFKLSKRVVGENFIQMRSMKFNDFQYFVSFFWKYQWTNVFTPLDDGIISELFSLSGGIPGFAIKIYQAVQDSIIGRSNESITISALRDVVKKRFSPLIPFTNALLSDDRRVYGGYSDICIQKELEMAEKISGQEISKKAVKKKGVNQKQLRYILKIEKSVIEHLSSLGIEDTRYKDIDIKYYIEMFLSKEKDDDKLVNLTVNKILEKISGKDDDKKISKDEMQKKVEELKKSIT